MKHFVLICAIVLLVLGFLSLLIGALFVVVYFNTYDATTEHYDTIASGAAAFLAAGGFLSLLGTGGIFVRIFAFRKRKS